MDCDLDADYVIADEIREKTVLNAPVTRAKTARSKMAIKAIIKAYSTRPWPFSFGENNMMIHLLPL
jgi:hypothetical protein